MTEEMKKGLDKVFEWYLAEECEGPDTEDVQAAFDKYEETLEQAIKAKNAASTDLLGAVCTYGEQRERKGFKDGFSIAFQIFSDMQGRKTGMERRHA
ncbi:hypothetical protein NSB25_11455 [Acetatifactor muris]|uniref:Uncharacterized protein n=1 Tax=Acetatifactor muris TaxID=879566 RepID=A0A2K4ZGY3_9FIRM|nr:hypothetical protein [Acetatifactor muris]MCR2047901.1 hypothetical protein [Acetatifactor muris]SOY29704.1 hypothetical protein AMURIS_02425 [Acetatifactor muris]